MKRSRPLTAKQLYFLSALAGFFVLFTQCSPQQDSTKTSSGAAKAQKIVDKAIKAHGGEAYQKFTVAFDFREIHYYAAREGGQFHYERTFTDSLGRTINDRLTNEGFIRMVDGDSVPVTEEKAKAYSNSVNSVMYFTFLPYFLNDAAVDKRYLGEEEIKGELYHKIKVTFHQEGGGEDYQDEYIYWFSHDAYTLDYLAYNYLTDGGGARFRQAFNPQRIGGILFQDYYNFKPKTDTREVTTFGHLFERDSLELLSEIVNENILMNP